jgi:hypothetical protein
MHEVDLLRLLRSQWIAASVSAIAETDAARQDLEDQLSQFFDVLCLCVESRDPHQLDHLMSSWAQSLTTTDLEGITSTLTRLIATLQQQTAKVIWQNCPLKRVILCSARSWNILRTHFQKQPATNGSKS